MLKYNTRNKSEFNALTDTEKAIIRNYRENKQFQDHVDRGTRVFTKPNNETFLSIHLNLNNEEDVNIKNILDEIIKSKGLKEAKQFIFEAIFNHDKHIKSLEVKNKENKKEKYNDDYLKKFNVSQEDVDEILRNIQF